MEGTGGEGGVKCKNHFAKLKKRREEARASKQGARTWSRGRHGKRYNKVICHCQGNTISEAFNLSLVCQYVEIDIYLESTVYIIEEVNNGSNFAVNNIIFHF